MTELTIINNLADEAYIDTDLDAVIAQAIADTNKTSLWALDAYSVLTAVSARAEDLEKQNLLGRFWGSITGQNRKMSIHNQQDLAHAQMLAQEMLVKLSEQNAISFEIAVSLGDKLSLLEQDFAGAKVKINHAFGKTQEQIKGIYQNLNQFFDKVKSKIEELEAEFRRNDDLLFWKETLLEHKVYNGLYYEDMNNAQKILCMVQEFFTVTKGHWNSRDISFLRSSLRSVGITPDMPLKPLELVQQVQKDPALLEHLVSKTNFADEFSGLMLDMPMLASLKQTIDVKGSEKHVIDTIAGFSPDAKVEEIEKAYITNTVLSKFGRSLEREHKAFDVAVDLLGDLLLSTYEYQRLNYSTIISEASSNLIENQPKNGAYPYAYIGAIGGADVLEVFVKPGDSVEKGKILASFSSGNTLYFVYAAQEFKVMSVNPNVSEGRSLFGVPLFTIDNQIVLDRDPIISASFLFSDEIETLGVTDFELPDEAEELGFGSIFDLHNITISPFNNFKPGKDCVGELNVIAEPTTSEEYIPVGIKITQPDQIIIEVKFFEDDLLRVISKETYKELIISRKFNLK
jgi:hypothetical protein